MALQDYTKTELETMVLAKINGIKGLSANFINDDATESYESAARECGFEVPETTDTDKGKKYNWLIERMKYWFLDHLLTRYILEFDKGEFKAEGIKKGLIKILSNMDKKFNAAKSDPANAALFLDSSDVFGDDLLVLPPGFIDDRIGQATSDEIDDRS